MLGRAAFLDVLHVPPLALDTAAVTTSDKKAPGHTKSITKHCSKCALRCVVTLHIPQLPLDGAAVLAMVSFAPGHSESSPSTAPHTYSVAWMYCSFSADPGLLLHPPWLASPQVTADLWRSNAAHANLDTWMCCAFLRCRWILAAPSPGATPHPHTFAGSIAVVSSAEHASASVAAQAAHDVW